MVITFNAIFHAKIWLYSRNHFRFLSSLFINVFIRNTRSKLVRVFLQLPSAVPVSFYIMYVINQQVNERCTTNAPRIAGKLKMPKLNSNANVKVEIINNNNNSNVLMNELVDKRRWRRRWRSTPVNFSFHRKCNIRKARIHLSGFWLFTFPFFRSKCDRIISITCVVAN